MNKFDTNELINCFKMTVDLEGIKKLEEYIKNLEQENTQLKKQYCERTDCSGRLGNSRKVERLIQENEELHNKIDKAIEILKEHFVEEYIRSCDTSDGVGRYEIDTEHWTYKVYEQLKDSDVDE